MSHLDSIAYVDAKARVVRSINLLSTFAKASTEYSLDRTNSAKRSKIRTILRELSDIRRNIEADIQTMESAVSHNVAPDNVTDNTNSDSLINTFHTLYYDLAAYADTHALQIECTNSNNSTKNESSNQNNISNFWLPKRKFPIFSGVLTEWQGFEDLFKSILSHTPELPV